MKFTIIGYESSLNCHVCRDENGLEKHLMDILVSADIPKGKGVDESVEKWEAFCRSLIGRTIEVGDVTPFVSIAHNVKLV